MILYLSPGTSYEIYNRQFNSGAIPSGYQVQRFHYNLISGLSELTDIVSLSALPYKNINVDRIAETYDGTDYVCIRNRCGKAHKFYIIKDLITEATKIVRKQKPQYVLCDSVSLGCSVASLFLSRRYKVPSIAIVTDVPLKMVNGSNGLLDKLKAYLMKKHSAYILLTEQMNEVVNPKNKPFMIMEGSCDAGRSSAKFESARSPKVCMYSGGLWKKDAGIEYLIEGFIKAEIPDCELHFYGDGPSEECIKNASQKHPEVKYMGCITNEELTKKQDEAALLINPRPSDQEFCKYSFPSKTFEYMASGVPVLMTRLPGIPDEYFQYVYTIDEETPDGACDALKKVFSFSEQERAEKGSTARDFVMTNKNNRVQSKRIFDFLKDNL